MQTAAKSVVITDSSWEESVSAWMDGEDPDDILPSLLSKEGRQTWDTYHLIGDSLRNSDLALTPSAAFQARLARALDAELPIVAAPRRRSPLRVGLSGLAVAAAVATVAWVAQPYLTGAPATEVRVLADASSPASASDDSGLRDYLEAHRQMAGPSAVRQVSFDVGAGR
ncbi:sigma-E factor negative regulatory protein [Achromobacter deleyi]|jgi:sigma-E factor negative regulatory protein RseA|uniref:sigma-E factor negative regulatory protein n=1 Tax=Achromobacter deleyi TaxID=1353891 RepID=UPI0014922E38|nr:sigma-E factor negative regulatory protein [Achromobacter deleyi]QVQ24243.1 sigma-E factor negative regulatory protein [Achromobacter deleyi]UIP19774.1 sigma-E factor negative regulatory protein [Achromobacter deleyi]